jgi:hypothetical protein
LDAFLKRTAEPAFARELKSRVEASRKLGDDEKSLGDESLVCLAFELLAGD